MGGTSAGETLSLPCAGGRGPGTSRGGRWLDRVGVRPAPNWEQSFAFSPPQTVPVNTDPTPLPKHGGSCSFPAPRAHHLPLAPALRQRGDARQLPRGSRPAPEQHPRGNSGVWSPSATSDLLPLRAAPSAPAARAPGAPPRPTDEGGRHLGTVGAGPKPPPPPSPPAFTATCCFRQQRVGCGGRKRVSTSHPSVPPPRDTR